MANTVRHKRSSTATAIPAAASLVTGELAINTADGKLYTKKDDGSVVLLGPSVAGSGTTSAGSTTIDFGTFPGKSDASVVVTGQTGIVAGSMVQAWIRPVATADHTADEHMLETFQVFAGNIVPGTGFTIYGFNTSQAVAIIAQPNAEGAGTRIYGLWTVAWSWN